MGVISVSLPDEYIEKLDEIKDAYSLRNRSDAMRQAIRSAGMEMGHELEMEGNVEGVLVIMHEHHDDTWMNRIQHSHDHDIQMQVHTHLSNGKCLEVMFVSSDADTMRGILREIHSTGRADYVKLVIS